MFIMKWRYFINVSMAVLFASTFAARAQQIGKIPTVGILWHAGSIEETFVGFGGVLPTGGAAHRRRGGRPDRPCSATWGPEHGERID
jgi:hypothetical protein